MTLDLRTRLDRDVEAIDVSDFFEVELPRLAAERSDLAVPGARELEVAPLSLEFTEGTWTLSIADDAVRVAAGDSGRAAVRLDQAELTDLVHDQRTPMTLLTAGTLDMPRGDLGDFLDWWVVLRSLLDARPVHTAGAVDFKDRDGSELDLERSFSVEDDASDMSHFLAEAGFLHLTNVFTAEEMAEVSADMDAALDRYVPDDGRSWWATTASGEQRAVRLQWFHEQSALTSALLQDDRLLRVATLTSDGHRHRSEGNTIEALVKPIGVVQGISDLPWHKDCSLGRHSYRCCSLTVGISVTAAGERSGQLGVVAGSHRALVQPAFFRRSWGLPEVPLPTGVGDVTVHCSCTLHKSYPPVERERRVMYTDFTLPAPADDETATQGGREIARVRERAYKVVSQGPGYVG
ncbi:MAG TPA: phytanoyl-CoA dioxygenase family protein [Acidimicrobiales bacterium]|nr:phytanoyl-CoA dioxygenase family protein [Acidimicrobiales bacterium]